MRVKKSFELRSNGQPRAAVPAFLLGIATVLITWALSISVAKAQSGAAPSTVPGSGPKTAEQQYKNIQMLKGIPADQLIPAMQFISASLGVECEFCHVQGAFEKDDKKTKQTARKMMEMMFAINADSFDRKREVTCYSCHRGSPEPVATPPVMEDPKAAKGESKSDNLDGEETKIVGGPSGEEVIDKYLKAVGGAAAVETIRSRVMKGTITFGDRDVPIEIFAKDPDKRVSFTHTPNGDSVTGFDGHEGWLGFPGRPAREMHGPDLDAAAMDADLHFAEHLETIFSAVEVRGAVKLGEHEAYLVVGQRAEKTPVRLYFDEQTGLLLRLVRFGETPLGRLPTQIDYADYRDVGGVKIPFRWTLARPGGRFTIQLTDAKQNVPVDDAKFEKPTEGPDRPNGPK